MLYSEQCLPCETQMCQQRHQQELVLNQIDSSSQPDFKALTTVTEQLLLCLQPLVLVKEIRGSDQKRCGQGTVLRFHILSNRLFLKHIC